MKMWVTTAEHDYEKQQLQFPHSNLLIIFKVGIKLSQQWEMILKHHTSLSCVHLNIFFQKKEDIATVCSTAYTTPTSSQSCYQPQQPLSDTKR